MKVAFLAPEFYNAWGGVGTYSIELIKNLSRIKDVELHVITPDIDNVEKKKLINSKFSSACQIHTLSKSKDTFFYNLKFQTAVLKGFNRLSKKYNFDILHSANLVHMPDVFLKFRKLEMPSVVTAHTTINGQIKGTLKGNINPLTMALSEKMSVLSYPLIRLLEWHYLRNTNNIISVSNKSKNFLHDNYNFGGEIKVIHNGIDVSWFNYGKISRHDCTEKFPVLENINKPIILFAGRLMNQKGIDVFIKAISILEKRKLDFFCVIAGRGNHKRLHQLIQKHKINRSNICYLGYVENDDLAFLYRLSSIFVLPSYYENFPISLLEAMSMKCSCIATRVGAVDEIIDGKKNGLIISPGDHERLADCIEFLLSNPYQSRTIAENGRKKVLANFTSEIMAQKTKEFYECILQANQN